MDDVSDNNVGVNIICKNERCKFRAKEGDYCLKHQTAKVRVGGDERIGGG